MVIETVMNICINGGGFGITSDWLDMFFMVVLGVLALYATVSNQRAAAIGLVAVSFLLIGLGWFHMAGYSLIVVGILILISIIASKYHGV